MRNGIGDSVLRGVPRKSPARIVKVARFKHPKDYRFAMQVFSQMPTEVAIDCVGDGPDRAGIQAIVARDPNLGSRVRFMGDDTNVPEVLADAQIFTLFSRHEGMPVSILEAMRAGLPVVASDVGGVGEMVKDGETGFLVKVGDLAGTVDRLSRLVSDPTLRDTMGANGRRRYEELFTPEKMIEQTRAVYRACLP